jgi:hypothetical protein
MTRAAGALLKLCASGVAAFTLATSAQGAQVAPLGAWRATNDCFLAIFVITEGGKAQAAYLSGEREENATWMWDGTTLTITSPSFPLDRFSAHLTGDRVEADYTWHDLDRDQLNRQTCMFERVEPVRL